jgi:uncharacterized protein YuzE
MYKKLRYDPQIDTIYLPIETNVWEVTVRPRIDTIYLPIETMYEKLR